MSRDSLFEGIVETVSIDTIVGGIVNIRYRDEDEVIKLSIKDIIFVVREGYMTKIVAEEVLVDDKVLCIYRGE